MLKYFGMAYGFSDHVQVFFEVMHTLGEGVAPYYSAGGRIVQTNT